MRPVAAVVAAILMTPGAAAAAAPAPIGNVTYHGGPVMAGEMQVYAIFWEPAGSSVSPRYNHLLRRYFRDVGGSGLYANNRQYPDGTGQVEVRRFVRGRSCAPSAVAR